jgi:excisionase family DNA binding protein
MYDSEIDIWSCDPPHSTNNAQPSARPGYLEPFVEAEEAAAFLRTSPRKVKELAREGRIPAHPLGDGQRRRWLFLLSELDGWMRSRVNSACDPCSI